MKLRSSDEGAIMLLGLLFVIFATSLLGMTLGTVEAVVLKEKGQDAADAAALSGAIMSARCMNLLVLTNIIMAALLSVLVALKLIESLALIGIAICVGLIYPTWGASSAFIPPLQVVREKMSGIYDELKPDIEEALEAIHDYVIPTIRDAGGAGSKEVAKDELSRSGLPHATYAVGANITLPVEDDTYARLCGEAGAFPIKMADQTLGPLGLGPVAGPLEEAMKGLTSSLSSWFCGDDGSSAPSYDQEQGAWYPTDESVAACEGSEPTTGAAGTAVGAKSSECSDAQAAAEASAPEESSGECRAGKDCSETGPYERKADLARQVCEPTKSPAPTKYSYQLRRGSVEYKRTKLGYKRGSPKYHSSQLVESSRPPCGPRSVNPEYSTTYQLKSRKKAGDPFLPLCTTEAVPTSNARQNTPETVTVRFVEVTRIFACEIPTQIHADSGVEQVEDTDSKSPQKVSSDAKRGGEEFQIRTLIRTITTSPYHEKLVKLAAFGEKEKEKKNDSPPPPNPTELLRGYSVAQSEYYFDGAEPKDAWMWTMNWRARLVRFDASEERLEPLGIDCATSNLDNTESIGACAAYLLSLRLNHELIAH